MANGMVFKANQTIFYVGIKPWVHYLNQTLIC